MAQFHTPICILIANTLNYLRIITEIKQYLKMNNYKENKSDPYNLLLNKAVERADQCTEQ